MTNVRAARSHLKKLLPLGHELVYDNYNGLGCGFSTTTESSGIFISIVAYPKWVTLFFFNGVRLSDPKRMLTTVVKPVSAKQRPRRPQQ